MDIISNRIPATPRSKYTKYDTGSNSNVYTNGTTVDLSNTVKLKGKTDQTVDGNLSATGDIVAYQTTAATLTLPIASTASLGCMKVGNNLTIAEDGTLNAEAGGASSWSDITDKPSTFIPAAHTHTTSDITDLSTYLHTHSNKTILDGISSTLVSN